MKVIEASRKNIHSVCELFDLYRRFYGQKSNLPAANKFIEKRMRQRESIVLLAVSQEGLSIGFAQLYPSFSSVAMTPILYLNDLYVSENNRNAGVGRGLIEAACEKAVELGASGIELSTQINNFSAKSLYEKTGFSPVEDFNYYVRKIST
ncbi:GNAT family N-acetyltransferase [Alteromonas sp. ASW11-36]|uniref:GNAT family N-acetyltransferase n=1 Tax=Alteromonas arenosi TaxID=3055817 RepID=A0ABT7SYA8_9ALTE|nr:GNAT family N-acetyltransferase [Alteromonas sp. ASW11-36]MDM7861150.1 GNAT family N-acetyltransferase [Alteromonas sp. ASW11-36]